MTSKTRAANPSLTTKAAILDATAQIMREEGYAAISSRKIAARAGLKSQLVHYHFRTMDELYLALFHRVEAAFFQKMAQAAAAKFPLRAIWRLLTDFDKPGLTKDFVAMATRLEPLRLEIARSAERTRGILASQLGRAMADHEWDQVQFPPLVFAVLMDGAARLIIADTALGAAAGHHETAAFVEVLLARLETAPKRRVAHQAPA